MLVLAALLVSQSALGQNPAGSNQGTGAAAEITRLENQIWEYWKTQKYDAMKSLLAEDAIFIGSDGFHDRNQLIEATKKEACVVNSVSLENVKVMMLNQDVAIITYKARSEGTCGGKPMNPAGDVNSSVWVKRGGNWLTISHHQSP